jgi:hypothetical protein
MSELDKPLEITLNWDNSPSGFTFVGGLVFVKTSPGGNQEINKYNRNENSTYFINGQTGLSTSYEIERTNSELGQHTIAMYYTLINQDINDPTLWKSLLPGGQVIPVTVSADDITSSFEDIQRKTFELAPPDIARLNVTSESFVYQLKINGQNVFGENIPVSILNKGSGITILRTDTQQYVQLQSDGSVIFTPEYNNATVLYKIESELGNFISTESEMTDMSGNVVGKVMKYDDNGVGFIQFPTNFDDLTNISYTLVQL